MNKHILLVIDNQLNPDKYTQEQLDENAEDAADATDTTTDATAAAYACTDVDATYDAAFWLDQYFKYTGENKQDYIDEINKDKQMNPHILFIIDHNLNPDKYTKEQLAKNAEDAVADYAADAAADTAYAAYAAANTAARGVRDRANVNAVDYWLSEYFVNTGENKQDYIDAINKDKQ